MLFGCFYSLLFTGGVEIKALYLREKFSLRTSHRHRYHYHRCYQFTNNSRRNIIVTKTRVMNSTTRNNALTNNEGERIVNGSCYCGKCELTVIGKPIAVSICHCTICRRLSGGPFSIQSLHERAKFSCTVQANDLWSIQSSDNVQRFRCKECGSPLYATIGKAKTFVVARSCLKGIEKDDLDFRAQHHLHYSQRVIDIEDDLPKFVGTCAPGRSIPWTPEKSRVQ